MIHTPVQGVASYQFSPHKYDESARQKLKQFMDPLIGPAPSPDDSLSNDERCVQTRVRNIQQNKPVVPGPFILTCINEFIDELIPTDVRNTYVPSDISEVWEAQNRPAQQAKLRKHESEGDFPKLVIQQMQKTEAYTSANDPRAISIVPTDHKVKWSTIQMSLSKFLKTLPCYAFSKPPKEIARLVTQILLGADEALLTDFSRMDGTIGSIPRLLELCFLKTLFRKNYHEMIEKEFNRLLNGSSVTKWGVFYEVMLTRLSGSPETSNFNSLASLFVAFVCYKLLGLTARDCMDKVMTKVIAGGDDAVMVGVSKEIFTKACKIVGFKGTGDLVKRGSRGVNFLSRYYGPDVWYGDPSSICDLRRATWKFHTTANFPDNMEPMLKLYQKSLSMSCNDAKTPVLGDISLRAIKIVESSGNPKWTKKPRSDDNDLSWWYRTFGTDNCYPQDTVPEWGISELAHQMPSFDYKRFCEWLDDCKGEDILSPSLFQAETEPIKLKADVVINGTTHVLPLTEATDKGKTNAAKAEEVLDNVVEHQQPHRSDEQSEGWTVVVSKKKKKKRRGKKRTKKRRPPISSATQQEVPQPRPRKTPSKTGNEPKRKNAFKGKKKVSQPAAGWVKKLGG
jgi:hypothetical protein